MWVRVVDPPGRVGEGATPVTENPSAEAYAVGWALFHAECLEYDADHDVILTEWAIPAIREPWLNRAQIALDTLALHRLEAGA